METNDCDYDWENEESLRSSRFRSISMSKVNIKSRGLKILIRRGIPDNMRSKMWKIILNFDETILNENVWQIIKKRSKAKVVSIVPFGIDISQEICSLDIVNIEKFKKLVHIIWVQNPGIEYATLIPYICLILMTKLKTMDAFSLVQKMIERNEKKEMWFFFRNMKEFRIKEQQFLGILKLKCGSIIKHAEKIDVNLSDYFYNYFCKFFIPHLSLNIVLSIFDAYLNEGIKILYRFTIAFFQINRKLLINTKDRIEFKNLFEQLLHNIITPNDFLNFSKHAYEISISRKKLNSLRYDPFGTSKTLTFGKICTKISLPKIIDEQNSLLTTSSFLELSSNFPRSTRFFRPSLVFKMGNDGTSIISLFNSMKEKCPYLLLIKTIDGIFGSYLNETLYKRTSGEYFGNFTTFVFSLNPLLIYNAFLDSNEYDGIMSTTKTSIMIGQPHPSIYLEDQFILLYSNYCECFHSPAFTKGNGSSILEIEVYKLSSGSQIRKRSSTFSLDIS